MFEFAPATIEVLKETGSTYLTAVSETIQAWTW